MDYFRAEMEENMWKGTDGLLLTEYFDNKKSWLS